MTSRTLRQTQVADQSRPTQTRQTKNFGSILWQRAVPVRAFRNNHSSSSSNNMSSTITYPHSACRKKSHHPPRSQRRRQIVLQNTTESPSNLVEWLQTDCPHELVPRILAYAGPQTTALLSQTNRFWRNMVEQESTWRTLCEELYKWEEGDEIPDSWREYYMYNPCVPVDFASVSAALALVEGSQREQTRSIRVLLRPGRYMLRDAITVHAPSFAHIEIETMKMPSSYLPIDQVPPPSEEVPKRRSRRSSFSLLDKLACRHVEVEDSDDESGFLDFNSSTLSLGNSNSTPQNGLDLKRATLVLNTRRQDEPILRVRQGCATLRNLELIHCSLGTDIWNGNAAVQIQPPNGPDSQPMTLVPAATATLEQVEISSVSGRGIVNIDGGRVAIKSCYIHDCAATGIYVGGPGSKAIIERTDVVRNGKGNDLNRRGIGRGHSGIYLEQGHASILDCNISGNSLTGISAVSPDNAILTLEESELVSNGSFQLEMPAVGTLSHRQSRTSNNVLAAIGLPRSRSGLAAEGL